MKKLHILTFIVFLLLLSACSQADFEDVSSALHSDRIAKEHSGREGANLRPGGREIRSENGDRNRSRIPRTIPVYTAPSRPGQRTGANMSN